jgi:hypothetical protein
MADIPEQVEKIMSATLGDFQRSIKTLAPDHTLRPDGHSVRLQEDGYSVEIHYEPTGTKTFGTLLVIPQAKITLDFDQASPKARKDFIHRFDFAFQRGGG